MLHNITMAEEISYLLEQRNETNSPADSLMIHSLHSILERCDEELSHLIWGPNRSEIFPEYEHCERCNMTPEELDVLVSSGVCISSDFYYMPLIYLMYASIFVVALLGNSLVLYTVAMSRKMHTVTNFFIANLAVGDLLIMVFCVPFSVASIIVLQYWPFGEGLCVFVNYCQAISIFVSAYTLVAISMDRYLAIVYPLRPKMTRLQAKLIIGVVWTLAILTTLPIPIFSGLDPTDSRIYQMYEMEVCNEQWPSPELKLYYSMALMVLQYFLPLVVMIFTYSRIAWEVWGCKRPKRCKTSETVHGTPGMDAGRRLLRKSTADRSPAKMIRMTLTVVLVYSLCWLPLNLLIVTIDLYSEATYWPHFHHLWFVFHWLAMSHTCYNPVILCWMNTKFREGYLNVLYHILPCCKPRITQCLLRVRQSSGIQRAHTYSTTAFGSSRGSRNHRNVEEVRGRRDSSCSNTLFMQVQHNAEYPLKVLRGHSSESVSNGIHDKSSKRVHRYSDLPVCSKDFCANAPTISQDLPRSSYIELS